MRIHTRIDSDAGDEHTDLSVFINGAFCGQLKMRKDEGEEYMDTLERGCEEYGHEYRRSFLGEDKKCSAISSSDHVASPLLGMKCPNCNNYIWRGVLYDNSVKFKCLKCRVEFEQTMISPAELEAINEMAKECVGFRRWASINCTGWSVIFARDDKYMRWKNSGPVVAAALEKLEDGE